MSLRNRPRFGSGFERLEDREVPAIISFNVTTTADTSFDRLVNGVPVDVNGNTSLRAVVQYANLNPETGDPAANKYQVDFGAITGQTITLDPDLGTLVLDSNFEFVGEDVTVRRWETTTRFGLFVVENDRWALFSNMTLQGGERRHGGAIWVDPNAFLIVETCDLINNTASREGQDPNAYGGAIYALSGSNVTITDSLLGLNTAEDRGGAIYTSGAATLTITGSTIIGNEATGNAQAWGSGGGLYIENTDTEISGTDIIGNEATGPGGGVYFFSNDEDYSLHMYEGQLHANTAGLGGGGLLVDADGITCALNSVSVTDNAAGGKGGGVCIVAGTLAGSLTALTGNTATGGIPGIAYNVIDATVTIMVPENQQTVESYEP